MSTEKYPLRMPTERELEIARKVREIHGVRDWELFDRCHIDDKGPRVGVVIGFLDGSVRAYCGEKYQGYFGKDQLLWLPTPEQYMEMLWEIGPYVWGKKLDEEGKQVPSVYRVDDWNKGADTPADAWMRVVEKYK